MPSTLYLDRSFLPTLRDWAASTAYVGSYHAGLVVLSVLIAILASFVALSTSERIMAAASRRARLAWTGAGAVSMGGGIWAMHFIGMLAFSLPCGIDYDPVVTLLSTIPAVLASGLALSLISRRRQLGPRRLAAGAALMGGGIGAMHYTGMAAMRLDGIVVYSPILVAVSIVVAIALAAASLSVRLLCAGWGLPAWSTRLLSATLMGCAIAGMHYSAMQAAIFFPEPFVVVAGVSIDASSLAALVAFGAALVAALTLVGSFAGRQSETAISMAAEIERRQAHERAALEGRSRLQAIFDAVVDAIVTIDVTGRILQWSTGAQHIFGYTAEEIIGQNLTVLMPEPHRSLHHRYVGSYLTTSVAKIIGIGRELTGLRKDGTAFPLELAVGEAHIGDEVFFTGIMRDITERKRAEQEIIRAREEAEAANAAKTNFLATMSHEIRTPMNGVLGMATLLAATPLSTRQQHLVDGLTRSGQGLLSIINDILDLSKIEAGRLELLSVDFDLRESVAEVADMFAERCSSKGLELVYYVDEDVPGQLQGDPVRLRQVLINIVGNAFKFTERGEILIEVSVASRTAEHVMLSIAVEDTGIGIPPDKRTQVFQAFEQADNSMSRSRGGTGLGLAISRELVGIMGGTIGLESEFGRGSRFHFSIRCGLPAEPDAVPRHDRLIERPMRVLLVDTNAISAHIMSLYFAKWTVDVEVASTAGEAEAALAASAGSGGKAFEVVMLDLKGLGVSGIELARKIRELTPKPELILSAGLDAAFTDTDLETLGAFAVLSKPVRPSVLFECLATIASGNPDHIERFLLRKERRRKPRQLGARILLVEDNPINQDVAAGILESMGCRVITAPTGHHAVRLAAQERFDLILMDCEMPEMDGFEATKHIRDLEGLAAALPDAEPSQRRLPIVALTAHALADVREKCLRAGMDDFLTKPFDEKQLGETLTRWLHGTTNAAPHAASAPEASPPSAAVAAAIDRSVIGNMRSFQGERGQVLLARVVAQFGSTAPEQAKTIRVASTAGDGTGVWQSAHSLKSSAAALGAIKLSQICASIEARAREQKLLPTEELLDQLDADIAAAQVELGELLERADAG